MKREAATKRGRSSPTPGERPHEKNAGIGVMALSRRKGAEKGRSTPRKKITRTQTPLSSVTRKDASKEIKRRRPAEFKLQQIEGWQPMELVDGIAIYNKQFNGVHYLNHTAAAIYFLCGNPISIKDISTILREEFRLESDPEDHVKRAVEAMEQVGIIMKVRGSLKK